MKRRIIETNRRGRRNPYFRSESKKRRSTLVVALFLLFGAISLLSYFVFSSRYHIGEMQVDGAAEDIRLEIEQASNDYLDKRTLFVFPKKHPWLFSEATLEELLLDQFPLNTVVVTKSKRTITITVDEKIRTYFVLRDDSLYSVDRGGYVINEVTDLERIQITLTSDIDIPTIEIPGNDSLSVGDTVLSESLFEKIVYVIDEIQANTLLSAMHVSVIEEEQRMNVETDSGVVLYLALNREMSDQISKLEALISRKLVDLEELTYIDLRYQNRLYYH